MRGPTDPRERVRAHQRVPGAVRLRRVPLPGGVRGPPRLPDLHPLRGGGRRGGVCSLDDERCDAAHPCGEGLECRDTACFDACSAGSCPAGGACVAGVCVRPPSAPDASLDATALDAPAPSRRECTSDAECGAGGACTRLLGGRFVCRRLCATLGDSTPRGSDRGRSAATERVTGMRRSARLRSCATERARASRARSSVPRGQRSAPRARLAPPATSFRPRSGSAVRASARAIPSKFRTSASARPRPPADRARSG